MAASGGKKSSPLGPTQPPPDPSVPDLPTSSYDPSDFVVTPTDTKGVSYRFTFRGPPDFDTAIDQWISSGRFPFRTRGEVLRWCVRQGLRQLDQMEPGVVSVTQRVDILTRILNEESSHSDFLTVFKHLDESVQRYMSDQAPMQALRVIAMAKHQFEGMPEGHWRERYLGELDKRFGFMLEGKTLGMQLT